MATNTGKQNLGKTLYPMLCGWMRLRSCFFYYSCQRQTFLIFSIVLHTRENKKKNLSHSWNNFRIQLLILNSGWKQGVAKAFSLYQNIPDVLSFDHDQDSIQCVHGIRFLSLAWLVLGNSFLFAALSLTKAPVTGKSQRSVWCCKVEKHIYIYALLKKKIKK